MSHLPSRRGVRAAIVGSVGLALAQLSTPATPGTPYNLGIPTIPGTRTPEYNPGTTVTPPDYSAGSPTAPSPGAGTGVNPPNPSAPTGPAYSFGAAPPPITAPGR